MKGREFRHAWRYLVPTLSWSVLGLACGIASAAESPADGLLSEEEFFGEVPMVLSASRLTQPVSEAPGAVTVINREMIKASGFREIADLFRLVPGFYVGYYSGNFPTVSRGSATQYSSRMQVLVDGRSVYTPLFGGVEWADLPLAMEDIERIEVIRGPNAATYGANSYLAIINIITRHAAEDRGRFATVRAGDHGIADGAFRYGGKSGNLDYRVTLGYQSDDGFDNNDNKRVTLVTLRGDYRALNGDQLQFQAGYNGGQRRKGFVDEQLEPPHDQDVDSHFEQFRWQHFGAAGSEFSVQYYHTYHRASESVTTQSFASPPFIVASFDISNVIVAERDDVELQQIVNPTSGWRFVVGAGMRRDRVSSPLYFGSGSALSTRQDRVFANAEWRVVPDVLLHAGAMIERNDLTGTDTSPRIALTWHVEPEHTLRASVSQALRTPVLFETNSDYKLTLPTQLGPVLVQRFLSSGGLAPEKITSRELGYLGRFWQGALEVDTRLFRDEQGNVIGTTRVDVSPLVSATGYYLDYINRYTTTTTGIESQLRVRFPGDAQLWLSHSLNRVVSTDPSYKDTVPLHLLSLLAVKSFAGGYQASAGYYKTSELEAFGSPSTRLGVQQRLDVRLAKEWGAAGKRTELALVVQNLLATYQEFHAGNDFDRRAFLTLSTEF